MCMPITVSCCTHQFDLPRHLPPSTQSLVQIPRQSEMVWSQNHCFIQDLGKLFGHPIFQERLLYIQILTTDLYLLNEKYAKHRLMQCQANLIDMTIFNYLIDMGIFKNSEKDSSVFCGSACPNEAQTSAIYVYGCDMNIYYCITWKVRCPRNLLIIANFWHSVSKSWLRPWVGRNE